MPEPAHARSNSRSGYILGRSVWLLNRYNIGMSLGKVTASLFAGVVLFAADTRDPKAVEIAHAMQQAMGGQEAWNAARFVRFDFKGKIGGQIKDHRRHLWGKRSGRYRLGQRNHGVLMNIV